MDRSFANTHSPPSPARQSSGRLPQANTRKMIAALQRAGFVISGSKGGHHYVEHKDDPTRWTTVSVHPGDLHGGTVRAILKQTGDCCTHTPMIVPSPAS